MPTELIQVSYLFIQSWETIKNRKTSTAKAKLNASLTIKKHYLTPPKKTYSIAAETKK